jgi:protein phosphatase
VAIALGKLQLRARDCLLLCSDGLTTHLTDEDIRSVVLGAPDLSVACDRLVNLAKARGGLDNITAVLAGLGGQLPVAQTTSDGLDETFEVVQSFN